MYEKNHSFEFQENNIETNLKSALKDLIILKLYE